MNKIAIARNASVAILDKHEPVAEFYETEDDIRSIMESVSVLEQLFPDKVVTLCRRKHVDHFYVGENCIDVWGMPAKHFKSMSLDSQLSLIHPDDLPGYISGAEKMVGYFNGNDPAGLRFVATYRMKHANGNFFRIQDERLVIKTISGRFAYFTLFNKINDKHTLSPVTFEVYRMINNRKVKVNEHVMSRESDVLTTREVEIISLIDRGFSNDEIAHFLSLSVFTVKNHKQRLFRKIKVKNSLELLRYARAHNLVA